MSALVMTGATAALAVYTPLNGLDLSFGPAGWFWLACIALVSTVLAMFAFLAGLRRTGPSTAAILSTFEPVVTTALAALILNESLTLPQYAGGLLVLSSVVVLQPHRPRRPTAVFRSLSTIVRATGDRTPQTWRRALSLPSAALRAPAEHPLPEPPHGLETVHQAMINPGSRRP